MDTLIPSAYYSFHPSDVMRMLFQDGWEYGRIAKDMREAPGAPDYWHYVTSEDVDSVVGGADYPTVFKELTHDEEVDLKRGRNSLVQTIALQPEEKAWLLANLREIAEDVERIAGVTYPGHTDGVYNGPPWPDEDSLRILCVWDWLWDLGHEFGAFHNLFSDKPNPFLGLPTQAAEEWYLRAGNWIELWDQVGM